LSASLPRRVVVLGGGVAGLAVAHALENPLADAPPVAVVLLEAADQLGGNLRTTREDGFTVEWGPNGFLDSEPATLAMITRVNLDEELLRSEDAARRRYIFHHGKLREVPATPRGFLGCDLFDARAKARVLGEVLVPRRVDLGRAAEDPTTDETVYAFGLRRLGRDFAEVMLDPMVRGITGGDCRRVSLAAAFPRMVELERDHGSLFRALAAIGRQRRREQHAKDRRRGDGVPSPAPKGVLTGFRFGMATLPRAIAAQLRGPVRTGWSVAEVVRQDDGWWVTATDGRREGPFAAVVDAAPAHAAARHQGDPEVRSLLAGIRYNPLLVVAVAFDKMRVRHPLDGFGMLTPSGEQRPLLGVLWDSSTWQHRAPAGLHLLRCMSGDPAWLDLSDDEIIRRTTAELDRIYGVTGAPQRVWVFRHRRAIAEYEVGHLARLAALDRALARTPGMFLAGSSYRGIAVNACLKDAAPTADRVRRHLAEPRA
jgi:protoporphyrinogen/coproporphyrinogen III oxidase